MTIQAIPVPSVMYKYDIDIVKYYECDGLELHDCIRYESLV